MSINIMVKIKHISRVYTSVLCPGHSTYKITLQNRRICSGKHELSFLKSGSAYHISLGLFLKIFPNFTIMGQSIAVPSNDPNLQTHDTITSLCLSKRASIFDIILLYNIGTTPTEGPGKDLKWGNWEEPADSCED